MKEEMKGKKHKKMHGEMDKKHPNPNQSKGGKGSKGTGMGDTGKACPAKPC